MQKDGHSGLCDNGTGDIGERLWIYGACHAGKQSVRYESLFVWKYLEFGLEGDDI